jgi:Uma2 family endonuclease
VIEVRSPDDKPRLLREKMEDYMANGVKLAWLVDPLERTVTLYRPGRAPETLANPASVAGEGPVEGFVLDLDRVFD